MGAIVSRHHGDKWDIENILTTSAARTTLTKLEVKDSLARGARIFHQAADAYYLARKELARKEAAATRAARKGGRV